MPATYKNIASTTLGSSQSVITLSSIPQTYTDLMLLCSIRGDRGVNADPTNITLNGGMVGGTDYSYTTLLAAQGSPSGARGTNDSRILTPEIVPQQFVTGNVFCNFSIYLPNYTTSGTKSMHLHGGFTRSTASPSTTTSLSGLVRTSSPVTSIAISGNGYIAGSSFYLYGIKKD